MRRAPAAVLLSVLLLLVGTGCATIPEAGAVQTAAPTAAADDPNIVLVPARPKGGESPQDIVTGFVLAAVAPDHDYAVARQYLTADAARRWDPAALVRVHQQSWTPQSTGTGRVRLTLPQSASVDSDGTYREGGGRQPLDFALQQVGGQWRISSPPKGIVLSQDVFTTELKPAALQFFDVRWSRLVPDVRWFPVTGERTGDVVRALLRGPSGLLPLGTVTQSAFPKGSTLVGPVVDDAGTTVVRLHVPGSPPDQRATDRMQQQLAGSLAPKATSAIRLIVDGRVAPTAEQPASSPAVGPDPVVLSNGRFGTLSAGRVTEDPVLGRGVADQKPRAVTVAPRRFAAVLTPARGVVWVDGQRTRVVDPRLDLIAPTTDQLGWVYTASAENPAGMRVGRGGATSTPFGDTVLAPPGPATITSVTAIEVSPDGTRMLVVVQTDAGPSAWVAGIERRADGTPVGLTPSVFPVDVDADSALGGTWLDSATVAVLTGGTDTQSVIVQQVGGLSSRIGGPSGASSIAGPSSDGAVVLALLKSGALYQRSGSLWEVRPTGSAAVQVLAVQR